MKKTRIAIIMEVKKRELPFFCILKKLLMKEGFDAKIIPFRSICTWRLLFYRPDIVIVNGIRTTYPYAYSQIFLPKILFKSKIICYYSEQLGYFDKSLAYSYNNQEVFDNVDYHVGWGPRFCRDLRMEGVDKEKLWYIGSLQYDIDFYSKKTNKEIKFELSQKYNIAFDKKWILYADNIIKEYQPNDLYEGRRQDTYRLISNVASINNDSIVIYRPHPDTSDEEMKCIKQELSNFNNVIFNNEGHIFTWTSAIDASIIWCSTSSIQAMFQNKHVYGFKLSDHQNLENYWYEGIFPLYDSYEELAYDIQNSFNGIVTKRESETFESKRKFINDWYFKNDGYSFNRMIYLIKIAKKSDYIPISEKYSNISLFATCKILFSEIKAYLGDIFKGRCSQKNVSEEEIRIEEEKFNFEKYKTIDLKVIETENGKYIDLCQNL